MRYLCMALLFLQATLTFGEETLYQCPTYSIAFPKEWRMLSEMQNEQGRTVWTLQKDPTAAEHIALATVILDTPMKSEQQAQNEWETLLAAISKSTPAQALVEKNEISINNQKVHIATFIEKEPNVKDLYSQVYFTVFTKGAEYQIVYFMFSTNVDQKSNLQTSFEEIVRSFKFYPSGEHQIKKP